MARHHIKREMTGKGWNHRKAHTTTPKGHVAKPEPKKAVSNEPPKAKKVEEKKEKLHEPKAQKEVDSRKKTTEHSSLGSLSKQAEEKKVSLEEETVDLDLKKVDELLASNKEEEDKEEQSSYSSSRKSKKRSSRRKDAKTSNS